jgi:peptide/nickel transport system permease protein
MFAFIVKRLLWMLPFLVAISFLSFVLIQLPPGDYVTTYIATLAASNEVVDQNTAADLRSRFRAGPADDRPVLEVDLQHHFPW